MKISSFTAATPSARKPASYAWRVRSTWSKTAISSISVSPFSWLPWCSKNSFDFAIPAKSLSAGQELSKIPSLLSTGHVEGGRGVWPSFCGVEGLAYRRPGKACEPSSTKSSWHSYPPGSWRDRRRPILIWRNRVNGRSISASPPARCPGASLIFIPPWKTIFSTSTVSRLSMFLSVVAGRRWRR